MTDHHSLPYSSTSPSSQSSPTLQQCSNCLQSFPITILPTHSSYCHRNVKPCPLCDLLYDITDPQQHNDQHHSQSPQNQHCQYCNTTTFDLSQHHKQCLSKTLDCQYCDFPVMKKQWEQHIGYCAARTKLCEKCCKNVRNKEYQEHYLGCLGGGKGGGEWVWDGMDDERYGYGYGMDAWEFVGAVDSGNSYGNNNSYCYSNCYGYGNGNVPKTVVRQVPRQDNYSSMPIKPNKIIINQQSQTIQSQTPTQLSLPITDTHNNIINSYKPQIKVNPTQVHFDISNYTLVNGVYRRNYETNSITANPTSAKPTIDLSNYELIDGVYRQKQKNPSTTPTSTIPTTQTIPTTPTRIPTTQTIPTQTIPTPTPTTPTTTSISHSIQQTTQQTPQTIKPKLPTPIPTHTTINTTYRVTDHNNPNKYVTFNTLAQAMAYSSNSRNSTLINYPNYTSTVSPLSSSSSVYPFRTIVNDQGKNLSSNYTRMNMNEEYGNLDNDAELQMAIMMSLAMNKEDQ